MHDLFMQRDRKTETGLRSVLLKLRKNLVLILKVSMGMLFENLYLQIEKAANDGKLKLLVKSKLAKLLS